MRQYFAIDTSQDVTALLAALALYDGQTQVLRNTPHDVNLKIVGANITNQQIAGDPDLAPIASAIATGMPNALCQDVFMDLQDRRERVFPMLGEMPRSQFPEFNEVAYIAQVGAVSATDDGKTPWTAFGPRSLNINGGADRTLKTGTKYIGIGVMHLEDSTYGTENRGNIVLPDASATERTEFGTDHPVFPGALLPTLSDNDASVKQASWVSEGGGIYSQADWGRNTANFNPFQDFLIVTSAVDPKASFSDNLENSFFKKGSSEAALNPGEWFLAAGNLKMYVRLLDSAAPPTGFNISNRWDGLGGYYLRLRDGKNIQLNNPRLIGMGLTSSDLRQCTDLVVAGGQFGLANPTGNDYFLTQPATRWKFTAATYGRLTYDRSDLADEDGNVVDNTHPDIQALIDNHGSPASAWADMDLWPVFWGQNNGPGLNNNHAANLDNIDGIYTWQTNGIISNSRGTIVTYSNGDGHSLSARNGGMVGKRWKRSVMAYGGRHFDDYVSASGESDAPYSGGGGAGTNSNDNIFEDFIIIGDNGQPGVGKAHAGIGSEADNDSVRYYPSGTGNKTGWVFQRFAISNLPNQAISLHNEQETQYLNYQVRNCGYHYLQGRNFTESIPFAAVVTANEATVTDVTANLLRGTGGTPTVLPLVAFDDYLVLGFREPPSQFELAGLTTAAAGTYTLAFEKYVTGATWAALNSLVDGTNALTTTGRVTCVRQGDELKADLYSQTGLYYYRIRLASGAFTTQPSVNKFSGRWIGSVIRSRGAHVIWGPKSVGWNTTNSSLTPNNSSYQDVDDFILDIRPSLVAETATIFNDGNSIFDTWKTINSGFYQIKTEANSDVDKGKGDNRGGNVTVDDILDANT